MELCIRQRLVQWMMSGSFLGDLMVGASDRYVTITASLPAAWRAQLAAQGISLQHLPSALSWRVALCRMYLQGMHRYLRLAQYAWTGQGPWRDLSHPIVLASADPRQVGQDSSTRERRKDTANWIFEHYASTKNTGLVVHVRGHPLRKLSERLWIAPEPFQPLSMWGRISFLFGGLFVLLRAGIASAIGNWWRAVFVRDEIEDLYVSKLGKRLAPSYLFCNPRYEYRPFWTYRAENAGSDVKFLFYSTNAQLFGPGMKAPPVTPGYNVMDWPDIFVWDDFLGEFLCEASGRALRTRVVGPIDYSDSDDPDPIPRTLAVAVFDVTAFQPCLLAMRGFPDSYYTQRLLCKFIDDVSQCLEEAGLIMLYKRKRAMVRLAGTAYRRKVESISANPHVMLVGPSMSARRVIERAIATIAIPYTSTALIGKAIGIPSIYYDPDGTLDEDRLLSHDVPLVRSRTALIEWLTKLSASSGATPSYHKRPVGS